MKIPLRKSTHARIALAFVVSAGAVFLPAASTIHPTQKYAYSANAGWINFRPDQPTSPTGIVFGDYFLSGYAYAANFGWIDFGDGTPTNGIRYQNSSATDFGVNHDGLGNLSGYAYAANVGWINFGWAGSADPNRPRVDLATGVFSGYAYGANIGWINLGAGYLTTSSMAITDTDGDGMADAWEREHFGGLRVANATTDYDRDGARDASEYASSTDPKNPADYMRIVSHTYDEFRGMTSCTVTFTTTPGRMYRLQTSNDLAVWSESGFGTFAPDSGATTTRVVVWPDASRKFIRAVAVLPLP